MNIWFLICVRASKTFMNATENFQKYDNRHTSTPRYSAYTRNEVNYERICLQAVYQQFSPVQDGR